MLFVNFNSEFCFYTLFILTTAVLEYKWNLLPMMYLLLYILSMLVFIVWLTSAIIQKLLLRTKPITYDYKPNKYLTVLKEFYHSIHGPTPSVTSSDVESLKDKKTIDERIDDFTKDIEGYIRKWFHLISDDEVFLQETRQFVDDIIRRFLQVIIEVDSRKLVHGVTVIFLNHFKEYQKTIKRQKKNSGSVEDLYRYAHIASKNEKTFEHIVCQLTNKVFRQFMSWEVYNSFPCKCVMSILAKKLTAYLLVYISSPPVINYKIANAIAIDQVKLDLQKYDLISLTDVDLSEQMTPETKATETKTNVTEKKTNVTEKKTSECVKDLRLAESGTPKISPKRSGKKIEGRMEVKGLNLAGVIREGDEMGPGGLTEVDSGISGIAGKVVSAPVKIHESKSASSGTWRNSSDLECISLGQDLLVLQDFNDPDSEIENLIEKKLWKDNSDSLENEEKQPTIATAASNQTSIEESMDLAKEIMGNIPSPNIPSFISKSIKPIGNATANTLQELQQSTVNNVMKPMSQATSSAMHKIGDLQDEAAGVMEGIFDFGMAGIRKGLRLTGLQDGPNDRLKVDPVKNKTVSNESSPGEKLVESKMFESKMFESKMFESKMFESKIEPKAVESKTQTKTKLVKLPPVMSEDGKSEKNLSIDENVWVNPLTKDSPNFDGQILLEKSIPSISMEEAASPDPEYEDTTDLATTTAKLRYLLQQRTSESNLTTPAVSPMPFDDSGKSYSTPSDFPSSSTEDNVEVDGALPSLYKFCARTATGVFQNTLNTIKTALPGNVGEQDNEKQNLFQYDSADWTYVASDVTDDDLVIRIEKLLNERRAFCVVDNAYEAVESLDVLDHTESGWHTPTTKYDDDLDELEMHIPLAKTLTDIFCELMSPSVYGPKETPFVQENVVKGFLILFGSVFEEFLTKHAEKSTRTVSSFIGHLPNASQKKPLALSLDKYIEMYLFALPIQIFCVKLSIGTDVFKLAAKTFLSSLQSQKINQDIVLQIFELFTSLLMDANAKLSPTYSA